MRNNPSQPPTKLQQTNVIYEFSCNQCVIQHSKAVHYVGMTQTTLSRRLTMHLGKGSIKDHYMENHQIVIDRKTIEENTRIIEKANNKQTLAIKEAIIIQTNNPLINKQFDKFDNILKLHHSKTPLLASNNHQVMHQSDPMSTSPPHSPTIQTTGAPVNNLLVNHSISPNINARIQDLLQDTRRSTTNSISTTPITHRLRSYSERTSTQERANP